MIKLTLELWDNILSTLFLSFNNGIFRTVMSLYLNWNGERKTYRYLGFNLGLPIWYSLEYQRWVFHSFRLGKHVDIHGRLYLYLGYITLFQDIVRCKHHSPYRHSMFIWT